MSLGANSKSRAKTHISGRYNQTIPIERGRRWGRRKKRTLKGGRSPSPNRSAGPRGTSMSKSLLWRNYFLSGRIRSDILQGEKIRKSRENGRLRERLRRRSGKVESEKNVPEEENVLMRAELAEMKLPGSEQGWAGIPFCLINSWEIPTNLWGKQEFPLTPEPRSKTWEYAK